MSLLHIHITTTCISITLKRDAKRNALNTLLLQELVDALQSLNEYSPRLLVLEGDGKVFCAGVDIYEVISLSAKSDLKGLILLNGLVGELFYLLYHSVHWVISVVRGGVYGGGLGILAASDEVMAQASVCFGFSEHRYAMVPGQVYPYLEDKIGKYAKVAILQKAVLSANDAKLNALVTHCSLDVESVFNARYAQLSSSGLSMLVASKSVFNQTSIVARRYIESASEIFAKQAIHAYSDGAFSSLL